MKKLSFLHRDNVYDQALKYYEEGHFEKAVEEFKKIISQPKKAGLYYNFSLFYLKESYKQLGFAYEHMGMYEEAVKNFSAAIQICTDYPALRYHMGLCFCYLEEFERAEQELSKALKINPRYTAAISLLGFTYVKLHRLNEAADCYQKALEITPLYADYHYLLGSVYALEQRFDLAVEKFRSALQINPSYLEAKSKMALIEDRKSGVPKLIDEFSKVFAVLPVNTPKANQLAEGGDIISNIILFYEKAVQVNPNYADLHYNLGMYYAKKGEHQQAIEAYLMALKINPNYLQAMVNLALTYPRAGKIDQGIQILEQALALHPDYPDLHYYLGTLYVERNNINEALEEFEKALAITPNYPECHVALAVLHENQGQKKQAAFYWDLYLKSCHPQEKVFPGAGV